jgi:plastocyanin domain-containing protein
MKIFFGLILTLALLMIGYLVMNITGNEETGTAPLGTASNVSIVDGKQIVEIRAKGGYLPRKSVVKAGMPTVLRVNTSGTFDCSSAIRIPSLQVSQSLPATGVTEIDLGSLDPGTLQGNCGMGMYPFEIEAEN